MTGETDDASSDDDRFRRAHQQRIRIVGETGEVVEIDLAESPLRWLATRRDGAGRAYLEPHEVEAGERFRRDFTLAGLSPKLGAAWVTPVSGGRGVGAQDYSEVVLAARQQLRKAIDRVGPELGSVLMDVCGFLKGLAAVERERQWPARAGKLVLKLALAALARHYGLAGAATGPDRAPAIRAWTAPPETGRD
ncbi:DUF6456 domain-containing protein [Phreatobacter sp.]|uniref:DUF6456 domain-containing protein n=1 Tax=Phreatobacter sp. TaxID=1966341 RepID=UPI003F6F3E3E